MNKKRCIIMGLFSLLGSMVFGQQDLDLSIRLYNKSLYYLDTPVQLKVTLTNRTIKPVSLELTEKRVHNLDFSVTTLANQQLNHSNEFIREKQSSQPVYYRELTLMPDEEYSFLTDLKDYASINNPGTFMIQALFSPRVVGSAKAMPIESNMLSIMIRPGYSDLIYQDAMDEETRDILKKEDMAPDAVIRYILDARMKDHWNRFYLYLDMESLYLKDPLKEREYRLLSEEQRMRRIETFKKEIIDSPTQESLLAKPESYTVLKTEYTDTQARVTVRETFRQRDYREIRQYTYHLHRPDNYWTVSDYDVMNLRTE